MAKLYTKKKNVAKKLKPKKETIDLILNFSKSFRVVNTATSKFEFYSN